jgi:hypothetical protein
MFFLEPNEAPNPLSPHGLIESYPRRRSTHNTFFRTGRCPSVLRPIKPETESEISGGRWNTSCANGRNPTLFPLSKYSRTQQRQLQTGGPFPSATSTARTITCPKKQFPFSRPSADVIQTGSSIPRRAKGPSRSPWWRLRHGYQQGAWRCEGNSLRVESRARLPPMVFNR